MRTIGWIIVVALIASAPLVAAWKEYPQPQLGFVVEFPAEPSSSNGIYKTTLVPNAAAHIYSVREDHAVYVATVVDLLDRKEEGATLLGDALACLPRHSRGSCGHRMPVVHRDGVYNRIARTVDFQVPHGLESLNPGSETSM